MSQFRLGQYLNARGAWQLLRAPKLAIPAERAPSVASIDFARLFHKDDCRFVVFDKDNTLTLPYHDEVVHKNALDASIKLFGADHVLLFSNSAGSPDDVEFAEATALEKRLGIRVLRHKERKPGGGQDLLLVTGGEKTVVIGDRLFTDIVFANLNGCHSIWVDPIDSTMDNVSVRCVRQIEAAFWRIHNRT